MLCPGSRSSPLALAAGLLADRGDLQLTTAVDERSAAFVALGLSTASGRAVAVVTTSGTAVANLLPAAVEADRSTQPLLLLTADRPGRLKDCGANQTVNQEAFLAPACRWVASASAAGLHRQPAAELHDLAAEAWHRAHGQWPHGQPPHGQPPSSQPPGPVQLNLPFDEPLHATTAEQRALLASLPKPPSQSPAVSRHQPDPADLGTPPSLDPRRPGVVVAGPYRGLATDLLAHQQAVRRWLEASHWPLLADPLAALPLDLPGRLHHWELQLDQLNPPADLQVLRLGPLPASRRLEQWLGQIDGPQLLISEGEPRRLDPLANAEQWCSGMAAWCGVQLASVSSPGSVSQQPCPVAQQPWHLPAATVGAALADVLAEHLPLQGPVTEPALTLHLAQLLPSGLPVMLAASSPVRDWLLWSGAAGSDRRCFSFRGASGIDGTLSLAMGLALELGPLVLVTGDLALLHDSNGWLHGRPEGPPLLVVLIDNGGGGIFAQLPIESDQFERLFAMPQGLDPLALAAAHGVPGRAVACLEDLPAALEWGLAQQGPVLLRVTTDRTSDASLRQQLRAAAQNAVDRGNG